MHGDPKVVAFPGGAAAAPVISLSEVTLERQGTPLLDRVTLSLEAHGITGLIGPNGAGKSILLRVITGLIAPDQGTVSLAPTLGPPALVAQKPVLLRRSVRANLTHALRIAGLNRRQRIGRLAELLVLADLTDHSETPARSLSGGEQQRLAFVRALAASPNLLLLDEPTASLDPAATAAIERLTREVAMRGVKIVFVTHDRAQAKRLCDDVVFLHRGHVSEHSPARTFFDAPASVPARRYLAGDLLL